MSYKEKAILENFEYVKSAQKRSSEKEYYYWRIQLLEHCRRALIDFQMENLSLILHLNVRKMH